jgi:hypothetical protein
MKTEDPTAPLPAAPGEKEPLPWWARWWARHRDRLKELALQYGPLALLVYLAVRAVGAAVLVLIAHQGLRTVAGEDTSLAEATPVAGATYFVERVLLPVRIGITAALTPPLERGLRRWPRLHRVLVRRKEDSEPRQGDTAA